MQAVRGYRSRERSLGQCKCGRSRSSSGHRGLAQKRLTVATGRRNVRRDRLPARHLRNVRPWCELRRAHWGGRRRQQARRTGHRQRRCRRVVVLRLREHELAAELRRFVHSQAGHINVREANSALKREEVGRMRVALCRKTKRRRRRRVVRGRRHG